MYLLPTYCLSVSGTNKFDDEVLVLGYDSSRVFDHFYLDGPIIQIVRQVSKNFTLLKSV